mgnify:CR=1 FL=1
MIYNTQRKKLPMPEYGRGIQEMVDYALTLENREERQRCARTIVSIMGNMFPHLRDVPDFKHKLWDHYAQKSRRGQQAVSYGLSDEKDPLSSLRGFVGSVDT